MSVENPVRYQPMNQRVMPGFTPSPESYAPSLRVQEIARDIFENVGTTNPTDLDIWTTLLAGMAHQQIANDLGGTRWADQLDRALHRSRSASPGCSAGRGPARSQRNNRDSWPIGTSLMLACRRAISPLGSKSQFSFP